VIVPKIQESTGTKDITAVLWPYLRLYELYEEITAITPIVIYNTKRVSEYIYTPLQNSSFIYNATKNINCQWA